MRPSLLLSLLLAGLLSACASNGNRPVSKQIAQSGALKVFEPSSSKVIGSSGSMSPLVITNTAGNCFPASALRLKSQIRKQMNPRNPANCRKRSRYAWLRPRPKQLPGNFPTH